MRQLNLAARATLTFLDARSHKSSRDILVRAALHRLAGLVEPIAGDAPAHGSSLRLLAVGRRQRSTGNLRT
jgi:hypothetical protein